MPRRHDELVVDHPSAGGKLLDVDLPMSIRKPLMAGVDTDAEDYATSLGPVAVNLLAGTATGCGNETVTAVARVLGSPFADSLGGSAGNDFLHGNAGDDSIDGRDGTDVCEQGAGVGPVVNCEG